MTVIQIFIWIQWYADLNRDENTWSISNKNLIDRHFKEAVY